jgi:hypothetical protein
MATRTVEINDDELVIIIPGLKFPEGEDTPFIGHPFTKIYVGNEQVEGLTGFRVFKENDGNFKVWFGFARAPSSAASAALVESFKRTFEWLQKYMPTNFRITTYNLDHYTEGLPPAPKDDEGPFPLALEEVKPCP